MGRPCVADAIASVAAQLHRPLELLVVDATGGAHPPLPALPTLSRARLLTQTRKLNRPAAANAGLAAASGEWIGFLDDDDMLEPTHVTRLLARSAAPDHPRLVYGQLWAIDRLHRVVQQRQQGFNPLIMYYNCQISAMSCLLHRSLRDTGHRLDESLATSEDWDFWLRLMTLTNIGTVREPTHFYHAEAGTSGSGVGLNRHNRGEHLRFHDIVQQRFAPAREAAWNAHFDHLQQGIALQRDGRIDAALAFYAQAMRDFPDEPNVLYLKAQTHLQAGQLQTARLVFRQAIFLNGDAADYHLALGDTCARLGQDDEARASWASATRFNPDLQAAVSNRLQHLAPAAAPTVGWSSPPAPTNRNAPCPCGSGLRYKACHGRMRADPAAADPASAHETIDTLLAQSIAAAAAGSHRRARAGFRAVLARDPDHMEALHADALLAWDANDLPSSELEVERALRLAPADPQISEDYIRIRNFRFERDNARIAATRVAALVGPASGRPDPGPVPRGTPVHLVSPFENEFGGTELHALQAARLLGEDGRTPVTLWSTRAPVPPALAARGVLELDPEHGRHPDQGVLVFFGSWQAPPTWLARCRPARLLVMHNVDNAPALLDLVQALLDQSSLPVELLMPSETFRVRCGLPGVAYPTPIDLARFTPGTGHRAAGTLFTVGRLSRNHHHKYHHDEPDLLRRLVDERMRVRLLGGTVLLRHFPPSRPVPNLELLPPGAEEAGSFLRTLDCFYYRTSPHWLEPAGRVIAEAMATGLPVVCARDAGFAADLITDGVDGYLFDHDDDETALRHLRLLRDDPELGRAIGAAARRTAELTFGPALAERLRTAYFGA